MPHLQNLLQTVSDSDNPDYVESHGPFFCRKSPWLGEGYYFWDGLISRAHWWGKVHYDDKYMICQAYAHIEDELYLDLAGDMSQLKYFEKCYDAINEKFDGKVKTVSFVIAKLKKDNNFPYKAMRVLSEFCGGDEKKIVFTLKSHSYLNLTPPMQICIYDRSLIKDYHIIYPEAYCLEGYV